MSTPYWWEAQLKSVDDVSGLGSICSFLGMPHTLSLYSLSLKGVDILKSNKGCKKFMCANIILALNYIKHSLIFPAIEHILLDHYTSEIYITSRLILCSGFVLIKRVILYSSHDQFIKHHYWVLTNACLKSMCSISQNKQNNWWTEIYLISNKVLQITQNFRIQQSKN